MAEELDVDVVAAMLRADQRENIDFLAHLATKLTGALPEQTTVELGGGFFSKKQVESVTVAFAGVHYTLTREKHGPVGRKAKLVRGVRLSAHEVSVDEWIADVAREIHALAAESATAKDALEKFILG